MTVMTADNDTDTATDDAAPDAAPAAAPRSGWRRLLLGTGDAPRWERPGLLGLLTLTAVLYLWNLNALGWANEFYAVAVQSGTQDWKALLFGSLDPGNVITVDKPPAALWAMALSGRLFGFSTASMLVPQVLMGVTAVWLLFAAVRRTNGPGAALLAGTAMALTPVVALMFRYNNPDALLVLLLVAAAYCVIRAITSDRHATRWMALAGVALGFAFLAKLMQAFVVIPTLGLAVLVAMPGSVWVRLRALLVGVVAMVVSSAAFIALVDLWPADSRPYIGGSTDNTLLQLTLGYNGLGRVLGGNGNPTHGSGGAGPGGPGGAMFGGDPGMFRMFGESMGTEVSWLLPAALIGLLAGLWFTRRAPRTDHTRAALLVWGGWLVSTALVFSYMKGIMHPYYTVALAPGVAATAAIAVREAWRGKAFGGARLVLGLMLAGTGVWNYVLLQRTPHWLPWLGPTVLIGAITVAAVLIVGAQQLGRYTAVLAGAGLLFGLAPTAAYTVETVLHSHGGPIPTSGPPRSADGQPAGPGPDAFGRSNEQVQQLIRDSETRWAAATVGSPLAGSLALSTGKPVLAIGGFMGGDPAPTLQQFQKYVADGQIQYFVSFGGRGPGGPNGGPDNVGTQISDWVQANFTFTTIDDLTVYHLIG